MLLANGSSNVFLVVEGPRNRTAGQPLVISDVKKGSIAHRCVTQCEGSIAHRCVAQCEGSIAHRYVVQCEDSVAHRCVA